MAKNERQRITISALKACGVDLIPDMVAEIKHMEKGTETFEALNKLAAYVYPKPKMIEHLIPETHKMVFTLGGTDV